MVVSITTCVIAYINGTYNSVTHLYSPPIKNLYFQPLINMTKSSLET